MLIFQQLKNGTCVACETEKGIVEVVPARSYWARQAERSPDATARAMIAFRRPHPTSSAGRNLAMRYSGTLAAMRKFAD